MNIGKKTHCVGGNMIDMETVFRCSREKKRFFCSSHRPVFRVLKVFGISNECPKARNKKEKKFWNQTVRFSFHSVQV